MKEFFKKNLTIYHIIGIIITVTMCIIYWWKVGKFTDYFLKNNIFAISIFGIVLGYISFDLIINSIRKNKENKNN
jgi:mannose/fructose/N-acetylgalactosamine-specific phosphotransferase system component IIC